MAEVDPGSEAFTDVAADGTSMGEDLGLDIGRSVARHANAQLGKDPSETTSISLGGELGDHPTRDIRFRDSAKKGFLTAYVRTREAAFEHKTATTITVSAVAIGAVLTGIRHLKYKKHN